MHPPLVEKVLGETGPSAHTSTAVKPFGTTTGGVGDLPGTPNESSVALLPDEKFNKPTPTTATSRFGGVGDLPGAASESSVAVLPEEKLNKPTTTSTSATGASSGLNTSNSVHPTTTTSSSGVNTSNSVHPTTTTSGSHGGPNTDGRTHPLTKAEEKVFGGHTHHEIGGASDDSKVDTTSRSSPAVPPKDHQNTPTAATHTTEEPKTQDVQRKPTLMDKVKGEAKVITGKLSHNEEKVDDGKRLMGKAIN